MANTNRDSNYQKKQYGSGGQRSNSPQASDGTEQGGMNIGRLMVFLVIAGILVLVGIKYFKGKSTYTNIPQEVQIKYVPSDFKFDLDVENTLAILSNPYRYSREFDQLIYDFNLALIQHVANRMNLSDSLKTLVAKEYDKHHPYLRRMMYNDFIAMKDTTASIYESWYQNELSNSVNILYEVASKYTCYMVNQIMATLLKTQEGKIYVKGEKVNTPCSVALTEGLQPMIARLKEQAAIDDFSRAKGILQERVERAIAELGTMEIRDRKGIGASKRTKFLGVDVSSTEMEMSAISILKVGFKLDKYFDVSVNSKSGTVTLTLPEPEILSHEVFPKIDKLDVGWLREIDQADFNKNMDLLRSEFRRDAMNSDVMEKAKKRAIDLMDTMMTPLIKSLNAKYQLKVRFKNVNPQLPEEKEPAPFDGSKQSKADVLGRN
jgi:hypothetical protein